MDKNYEMVGVKAEMVLFSLDYSASEVYENVLDNVIISNFLNFEIIRNSEPVNVDCVGIHGHNILRGLLKVVDVFVVMDEVDD